MYIILNLMGSIKLINIYIYIYIYRILDFSTIDNLIVMMWLLYYVHL